MRNGYAKRQENDTHSRFGQSGYKPLRAGSSNGGAYAGAASRHNSSGSTSEPKIIFNEDEYTRITTPRQDMLFKKGYLSKKKPWAGNANTSATSSTTESQSASHSTAGRGIDRNVTYFIEFLACLVRLPDRRVVSGKAAWSYPYHSLQVCTTFRVTPSYLVGERCRQTEVRYRPTPFFQLAVHSKDFLDDVW